jgi:hypothetical protein
MGVHAPFSIWKRSKKSSNLLKFRLSGFSKAGNDKPSQEYCLIFMPEKKLFRTSEKCSESGLYEELCKSNSEKARIPLSKTETFLSCRTCGSGN